jgi:hypothetical protein
MKSLNIWWCNQPSNPYNFGDGLNPVILNHYGYKTVFTPRNRPEVIFIGSIATWAIKDTVVIGSGIMSKKAILNPEAKWVWVRGPRTRKQVIESGGQCPEVYGDPALLLPRIYHPTNVEKKRKIGLMPHYVDYDQAKKDYPEYFIINLLDHNPFNIINQMLECEKIISSSLHGIIAAHAYGIPAAWIKLSDNLRGDGTKFHDHYESIGLDGHCSTIDNPHFSVAKFDSSDIHQILVEGKF